MQKASSSTQRDLLERIAAPVGSPLPLPRVLVVLAHPDDEVLALGGRLGRFHESRFLCFTDGAPVDGIDARAHGFPSLDVYREARQEELNTALTLAGLSQHNFSPVVVVESGRARRIADKDAALHLASLTQAIASEITSFRPEAILTHPYEGGHPDHDSCAFAVHTALRMLQSEVAPTVVEAPFYHADSPEGSSKMKTGSFLPCPPSACTVAQALSPAEQAHKQALLGCFHSQRETLAQFSVCEECYRIAPEYDFTQPPHPGQLLYESWGWSLTGERFRDLVQAALAQLQLTPAAA